MQSTDLNVKFKDFEILNVIQMSREHNSQRLITIGLRCEMLDSKKDRNDLDHASRTGHLRS